MGSPGTKGRATVPSTRFSIERGVSVFTTLKAEACWAGKVSNAANKPSRRYWDVIPEWPIICDTSV